MKPKTVILIVDDDPGVAFVLHKRLSVAGYEPYVARDGKEALTKVQEVEPDLIVLDIMLPGMDGRQVKAKLNESERTAHIPVLFLTAKSAPGDKLEGLRLRADDYLVKPYESDELLARVEFLLEKRKSLAALANRDGLTGLPSRFIFDRELKLFFDVAQRYQRPFSVAMIDIDNFKSIEDAGGRFSGDVVLKKVAETIQGTLRRSDVMVRYGEDEFAVLLPESPAEKAAVAMARVKGKIEAEPCLPEHQADEALITVSIGIADYQDSFANEREIFDLADKNMIADKFAKRFGPK